MQRRIMAPLAAAAFLFCVVPLSAHHSNSAYQVDKVISIKGIVKEWKWTNPHTWLYLTVDDGKGGKVDWACEGRAPGVLGRIGWDRTVLKPGEKVTVYMSPAKDGTHVGIVARVDKEDGTILGNSEPNR